MVSPGNIFFFCFSQWFVGLKTNSLLQSNRTCTYCFFATIKLAISTFIGRIELEKCISGQGRLAAILFHNNLTDRTMTFVGSQDNYVLVFTWRFFSLQEILVPQDIGSHITPPISYLSNFDAILVPLKLLTNLLCLYASILGRLFSFLMSILILICPLNVKFSKLSSLIIFLWKCFWCFFSATFVSVFIKIF